MKGTDLSALLLAASVGALSAGIVTTILVGSGRAGAGADPDAVAPATPVPPDLVERLHALADENRELRDRVADLEARRVEPARTPAGAYVTQQAFDELVAEVRERAAERPLNPRAADRELIAGVEAALDTIRQQERASRREKWRSNLEERIEGQLAAIDAKVGFTGDQRESMRVALSKRAVRDEELMRRWEEGDTDAQTMGEIKQTHHRLYQAELGRILTPAQLEALGQAEDDK